MNQQIIMYGGILSLILIVGCVFLGLWYQKRVQSASGFLMAGRSVPFWLQCSAYIGSTVGGASISGYTGNAYLGGLSNVWPPLFVLTFASLFLLIFSRRLNFFGRKYDAVTITDFVCTRYGERLRLPISLFAMLRPTILTGMQFLAIAGVLQVAFGIPIKIGVLIAAVAILLYIITAGQFSAITTQWIQGVLQTLGTFMFVFVIIKLVGSPSAAVELIHEFTTELHIDMFAADLSMVTVWLITMGVFVLVDPFMYMNSFLGKTPRTGTNAQLLGNNAGLVFGIIPFIGGMSLLAANNSGILNPALPEIGTGAGQVTSDAIYSWFTFNHAPTTVGTLIIAGLVMTIISCGSGFAMNGVTIFARDMYQKAIKKDKVDDKQMMVASRVSCIIVVAIGIIGALWLPILVPLWSLAQALVISALFAPVISAWFWKRSTTSGAFWSAVLGGCSGLAWALYAWISNGSPASLMHGLHACHVGLMVSIPVMIIVSLATKPDYSKVELTSYSAVGKMMYAESPDFKGQTQRGLYGWLGAKTTMSKVAWTFSLCMPLLAYIFYATFTNKSIASTLVWVLLFGGFLLWLVISAVGFKDLAGMIRPEKTQKDAASPASTDQ